MHQEVDCSKPYGRGWEWNQSVDSFAQVLHNQAPLLTFERPRTLDAQTDFEAILYEPLVFVLLCMLLSVHMRSGLSKPTQNQHFFYWPGSCLGVSGEPSGAS